MDRILLILRALGFRLASECRTNFGKALIGTAISGLPVPTAPRQFTESLHRPAGLGDDGSNGAGGDVALVSGNSDSQRAFDH